jgi:SAM-dependent methyltransferase
MPKFAWVNKVNNAISETKSNIPPATTKYNNPSSEYNNRLAGDDTCDGGTLRSCSNSYTDKDTWHSYFPVYQKLFEPIRYTATRVLEIGVREGGSISLWNNYFPNAEIYGVDITLDEVLFKFDEKSVFLYSENAYSETFVSKLDIDSFDVIIDDGPHTLQSMKDVIRLYTRLLKPNGMLIIEDVASIDWVPEILNEVPREILTCSSVHDRRLVKNRVDDILLVLRRTA